MIELSNLSVARIAQELYGAGYGVTGSPQWTCSGPLGVCVYDDEADEMHDNCLACEEPEERK